MSALGKISNILNFYKFTNFLKLEKSFTYRKLTVLSLQYDLKQKQLFNNKQSSSENILKINKLNFSSQTTENDEFRAKEEQKEREFELQNEKNSEKSDNTTDKNKKYEDIRERILKEALNFVPAHGWTKLSLGKGAEAIGYPGVSHGMFSQGAIELVHYFYLDCNKKIVTIMKEKIETDNLKQDQKLKQQQSKNIEKPIEFVKEILKLRLLMLEPYLKTWPQAIALMSLPQNAPNSLANMLTLVDDICFYSGDRSVDFGWYIRRVGLAGIYKMTEIYMLQDSSPGFAKTWEFLERRIDDGVYIHGYLDLSDDKTQNVQQALSTAFTTARNMLGINFNR